MSYAFFAKNKFLTNPIRMERQFYICPEESLSGSLFAPDPDVEVFYSESLLDFVDKCLMSSPKYLHVSGVSNDKLVPFFAKIGFMVENLDITFEPDETDFCCPKYCSGVKNLTIYSPVNYFNMFGINILEYLENLTILLPVCEKLEGFEHLKSKTLKSLTVAANQSNVLRAIPAQMDSLEWLLRLPALKSLKLCVQIPRSRSDFAADVLCKLTQLEKIEIEKRMFSELQFARIAASITAPLGPVSRFYKDRSRAKVMIELNGYEKLDEPIENEDAVNLRFKKLVYAFKQ